MHSTTLNQLLLTGIRSHDRPDLLWQKQRGVWEKISTPTFLCRVASLAWALRELGIRKGDRVAIFSENRPEWHTADLASLGLGAITVPLYAAESVERLQYILHDSEARLCFVSGRDQLEKVKAAWERLPRLEKVVPFAQAREGERDERVVSWSELAREDVPESMVLEFERCARSHQPDDVATLIYTSGTTGTPKGALLTQYNIASNVSSCLGLLGMSSGDLAISMLPLCHIYERTLDYGYFVHGVSIAYAESFEKVTENLREMRPTVMAVVPRFFEKFYARLMDAVQAAPAPKRKLFEWAVGVGRKALPYRLAGKPFPKGLAWRYRLADFLVYRKLHAQVGGRFRCFISGGGPLARELNEFFQALGLTIFEGYGLTETSPVIAVNVPGAVKLGTVGRPIPGVEVKIAEDGEILTRGPHVMKGYYKMEAETHEVMRDGWLHTGDVGFLDDEGFLTITDRKKDLIKTAGGKMIAPQAIENRLKASPYIEGAVVLGDKRKYAVALLVPNFSTLERHAQQQGIPFGSRAELLGSPEIQALLQGEVDAVNHHLAQFERVKRFAVLDREFSFADGQLTYTQKVRRRRIEEEYHSRIEQLYQEEAAATG
ncbi:MAG: long-chain fatty acid--CoA ligase [Acidobacteria bacterium]|nr:long-chain fatty acid--CoA ligase [Acidobacteriota bacterium]